MLPDSSHEGIANHRVAAIPVWLSVLGSILFSFRMASRSSPSLTSCLFTAIGVGLSAHHASLVQLLDITLLTSSVRGKVEQSKF